MKTLIVTDRTQQWPFEIPEAAVVPARRYLEEPESGSDGAIRVLNLCRTGRYQGRGYYVSLVAEARGHRPLPDVKTVEDLKSDAYVKTLAAKLDPLVKETLRHDESDRFELDVYLGKDPAQRHQALAEQLFANARAPLLRALLARAHGHWRLDAVQAIGVADIPAQHRAFLLEATKAFVAETFAPKPQRADRSARSGRPRLAILWNPEEPHQPSNEKARELLVRTAPLVGLDAELIERDALERLPEFDALFNRASPDVGGFAYEFARRAESLGMPVVDDSESILKCTNKVYMHELMSRHRFNQPKTLIVHRGNIGEAVAALGLPFVLKLPDSGFGLDVLKIESEEQLRRESERFFKVSELVVAQEWLPSDFDWRIGVYDRRPLFACKYFMAPGHWKVNKVVEGEQKLIEGDSVTMTVGEAPAQVVDMAVRASNLIGRSLYGVDLKQVEDRIYLIEVNCNPNIDAGVEDEVLGQALYREVLGVFARRIAEGRGGDARPSPP
jgi:glutathione synthase/RimK-type ligase-like ATP-grasp enzyme